MEIPVSHKLIVDVPREITTGTVTLVYTSTKTEQLKERGFGCAKGQFRMSDDFDEPLEDFKEYM